MIKSLMIAIIYLMTYFKQFGWLKENVIGLDTFNIKEYEL